MPILRHSIEEFLERSPTGLLIDVRSPAEYGHAHIPGAASLPLFSDEERKEVGTAYKQVSREQAIKIGLDAFGPKMRMMVEWVEKQQRPGAQGPLFLYCWRGGMRSGAVAWLLDLYGFEIHVLDGGYKSFRNYVLDSFLLNLPYRILGGYTGSGKTEVLHRLKDLGETVIDLEGLASHKGSAFGNIGMPPQPTQEMFENLLAVEIRKAPGVGSIWLEDESQRIGQCHIPHSLWPRMCLAPLYFLDIPFEKRLAHLVAEYGVLDHSRLADAIRRISKRLGGLDTRMALQYLEDQDMDACFEILLRYYDKTYAKGLQQSRTNRVEVNTFPCSEVDPENAQTLLL